MQALDPAENTHNGKKSKNQYAPENDATVMLVLVTAVCCPFLSFTLILSSDLVFSGPYPDSAWFHSSRDPILWQNKPREPSSCSVFLISACNEHRQMLLNSSSNKNVKSSRTPLHLCDDKRNGNTQFMQAFKSHI